MNSSLIREMQKGYEQLKQELIGVNMGSTHIPYVCITEGTKYFRIKGPITISYPKLDALRIVASMKDIEKAITEELLKSLEEVGLPITAENIIQLANIIANSYDRGVPIEAKEAVKWLKKTDVPKVVIAPVKGNTCTCGATKVGSSSHSGWCDIA